MPKHPPRVFDSAPLIALASGGILHIVVHAGRDYIITPQVKAEAVEAGRQGGHPDSEIISEMIDRGVIRVEEDEDEELMERILVNPRLSRTDASAIALASRRNGELISDEKDMREVARRLGLKLGGSLSLLVEAVDDGLLAGEEATEAVERMIAAGWFCSPALFKQFVDRVTPRRS